MSIELSSDFMQYNLRLPSGRWDLTSTSSTGPVIESAGISVKWRAKGSRKGWNGDLRDAQQVSPSFEGPIAGPVSKALLHSKGLHGRPTFHLEFAIALEEPLFFWRLHLLNDTDTRIYLEEVEMLRIGVRNRRGRWDRYLPPLSQKWKDYEYGTLRVHPSPSDLAFFTSGWQSWTFAGVLGKEDHTPRTRLGLLTRPMYYNSAKKPDRGFHHSEMYGILGDRLSRNAVLAGFLSQRKAFGTLEARLDALSPFLCLSLNGDRVLIEPGSRFETDWACIQFINVDSPRDLEAFYWSVAWENGARHSAALPVGWCSWYHFFQSVTQDDVMNNLDWAKKNRDRVPLDVIQVDDGFQDQVGDWLVPNRATFPDGMVTLSQKIQDAGFQAGLWLAPFLAKSNSGILKDHPEWMLRNRVGLPVNAGYVWDTFPRALDVTHPEVLDYIRDVIRTCARDWGYSYLKLDFLYAGALPGVRFDPTMTRAQALHNALKNMREEAGNEVTLVGCGCPLGTGIGVFDAMRVSPDIAPHWRPEYRRLGYFLRNESGLPAARNAIRSTLGRASLHRKWWINDPDCLLLREQDSDLTEAEIQSLATVISLSAGSLMISDHLPALSQSRIDWLSRLLPPLPNAAQVVDWFDRAFPERLSLPLTGAIGEWMILAIFNWNQSEQDVILDPKKIGLDPGLAFHVMDFWRGVYWRWEEDSFQLPGIPGHGCRFLAIRPADRNPQYIGDTLHVSQGLAASMWEEEASRVSVGFDLARRAKGEVWVTLPNAPLSVTLNEQPIEWRVGAKDVYAFEVEFNGEAQLVINWSRRQT
jgi:alpha-galactosidase